MSKIRQSGRGAARAAALALLGALAACGDGATGPSSPRTPVPETPAPVATITATPASAALHPRWTQAIEVRLADARGAALSGRTVTFASSDESVAMVSAAGLITARGIGAATITATSEGKRVQVPVSVTEAPVHGVSVSAQAAVLSDGMQGYVFAAALDERGNELTNRAVAWTSSDEGVLTVLPSGRVSAIAPGRATVTATVEGKQGSVEIMVQRRVASLSASAGVTTLRVGESTDIVVALYDEDGGVLTGRAVTFTPSDPSVAFVTADGHVRAHAAGTATVIVRSEGRSAVVAFTVIEPVRFITVSPRMTTLPVGAGVQLSATLLDVRGRELAGRVVTWSSSNPLVATVDASGVVTALKSGAATITAMSEGVRAEAQVTVP
jgi:uncharacterized protein YjdB